MISSQMSVRFLGLKGPTVYVATSTFIMPFLPLMMHKVVFFLIHAYPSNPHEFNLSLPRTNEWPLPY